MTTQLFGCKGYQNKIGILIAQLGTPKAPTKAALRPYLKQFLSDRRVIEINRIVWWTLLNGIILRTRPKRSAALYKRIWTEDGSPLMAVTKKQAEGVISHFRKLLASSHLDDAIEVTFGMRYGSPSLEDGVDFLIDRGCSRILLVPMYPQYAAATTASSNDAVFQRLLKRRWVPSLKVVEPYYDNPHYIRSLAATINEAYENFTTRPERLVLSYHGIPESYVRKGDPYCCQCTETTARLLPLLTVPRNEVIHTYQSRFGREPWLEPYTDVTIEKLGKSGIKNIAVACPGFTADCLETLDEMGNEGQELFEEHGGEKLTLISCLNDHPVWMEGLNALIEEELGVWLSRIRLEQHASGVSCPVATCKAKGYCLTGLGEEERG